MLGKLFKQDIRATWRDFILLFLSMFLAAIILPALVTATQSKILMVISTMLIFAIFVASFVISIACLFRLFNRNIYSKEGYLTMTLPVTASRLVLSKLLVGTGWIVLTGLLGILFFFLAMNIYVSPVLTGISWSEFTDAIHKLFATTQGGGMVLFLILLVLIMIASLISSIAQIYFCCTIGHLKMLKSFRVPAAVIAFFAISWLEGEAVNLIVWILDALHFTGNGFVVFQSGPNGSIIQTGSVLYTNLSMFASLILVLIPGVILYLGTVWMVNHRLELD